MEPLLKNKTCEIFLWLKISFCKEKQNWKSLMFIYDTTLGESWLFDAFLEKVNQLGWFSIPTKCSPSLLNKLRIEQIINYDSSWIKIISKSLYASRIVLVSKLFLQTFCEKILMFVKIILNYYSHLSKLIVF